MDFSLDYTVNHDFILTNLSRMEPEALKIWEHFLETFNQAERKTKRLVQPFYGTPDQVYANAETIKAAKN